MRFCVPMCDFALPIPCGMLLDFYITKYSVHKHLYITACDLRGYSPLASPNSAAQYSYNILQTDVWAMADALGFNTFHLIGHDHES